MCQQNGSKKIQNKKIMLKKMSMIAKAPSEACVPNVFVQILFFAIKIVVKMSTCLRNDEMGSHGVLQDMENGHTMNGWLTKMKFQKNHGGRFLCTNKLLHNFHKQLVRFLSSSSN